MEEYKTMNNSRKVSFITKVTDALFSLPQYLLPHHALSRLVYRATQIKVVWWKNGFIKNFIKLYKIDMQIAKESDPTAYENFNQFFTRPLKPEARPIAESEGGVISPVDAVVSQFGALVGDGENDLIQAKGHDYSVDSLLGGGSKWVSKFQGGEFATLYLSPSDYHRIHMPLEGRLLETIYVPGRLFSVNQATARSIPSLFTRNERLVTIFETEVGPMALVMVGALFVSGIETVWGGGISRPPAKSVQRKVYGEGESAVSLQKGEELGRFNMGSTVILLFGSDQIKWADLIELGAKVQMGQLLAQRKQNVL